MVVIFIKNILLFIQGFSICTFAKDNGICKGSLKLSKILNKSKRKVNRTLRIKPNSLKANIKENYVINVGIENQIIFRLEFS